MFTRYASAITSGTVMTFGLLFVMQLLISLQPGAIVEPSKGIGVDWIKMKIPDQPVVKPPEIFDKDKLTKTMDPPARPSDPTGTDVLYVPGPGPTPPNGTILRKPIELLDGPLVALVRVSPEYPARARANGIEGQVVVQFDVTELGYAVNIVVLESTNSVFNSAAVTAAKRFKFKARIVNGQAQPSYGIRNLFTFQMDEH